jgi:hypothetical protein
MRLLILFARSRGLALLVPTAIFVLVWCYYAHIEITQNPIVPAEGSLYIALTGLGAALFCSMMFGTSLKQLEGAGPQRQLMRLRCEWLMILVVVIGTAGMLALYVRGVSVWYIVLHWRNTIQGVALGCLSACVLPRPVAWTIPAIVLALCWFGGIKDMLGTPRIFAFPCYFPNSLLSWMVTIISFLMAITIYVWKDARSAE